jgi:hypothetical protein
MEPPYHAYKELHPKWVENHPSFGVPTITTPPQPSPEPTILEICSIGDDCGGVEVSMDSAIAVDGGGGGGGCGGAGGSFQLI